MFKRVVKVSLSSLIPMAGWAQGFSTLPPAYLNKSNQSRAELTKPPAPKKEAALPKIQEGPRALNKSAQIEVVKRSLRPMVPKTELRFHPVTNIPQTFPYTPVQRVDPKLPSVEAEKLVRSETYKHIWVEEYLIEGHLDSIGEVSEIQGGLRTASNGQHIFFESDEVLRVDDEIYVYREFDTGMGFFGGPTLIENAANLRVTSILDNNGDRLYKALVLNSTRYVEVGDKLLRGRMPTVEFSADGHRASLRAEVIADGDPPRRRLGDLGSIIYLRGGRLDGFREDQILSIMSNPQSRNSESKYPIPVGAVALIRIVKVTNNYSTALILKAHDAVYPGDFTASPERFVEQDALISERHVIDLSDDAIFSDPWALFRPYMSQPVPFIDVQEARRIPLDSDNKKRAQSVAPPAEDSEKSDKDSDEGWLDEGE